MRRIRGRDIRAIGFCVVSAVAVFAASYAVSHGLLVAIGLTGAYLAWLLTRPRMIRVFRRLRGDSGWDFSGYYRE